MRFFKFTIIYLYIFLATGCASLYVPPVPEYALPENTKVGLLVAVSEYPKHTHIGTTIFNNFTKEYEYAWNMEEAVFQTYKEEIEDTTGFNVINLRDHGVVDTADLDFVGVEEKQWSVVDANSDSRNSLMEKGIYAVVSISEAPTLASLECSSYGCTEHYSQGYGLFTRSFLGISSYVASASFIISTEIIQPPIDIGIQKDMREVTKFDNKNRTLSDFKGPAEFKNITEDELAPVKDEILEYIKSVATITSRYLKGSDQTNKDQE